MFCNQDSIEIIEEHLSPFKTANVCQHIMAISDKIWGASFRKCTISDQDFEKLAKILKKCKGLKYLNFNIKFIDTSIKLGITTSLLSNMNLLDTLCLHSNDIGDEGLVLLFYSISNLINLKSLDIGDCNLTDQSVEYIKDLICSNDSKRSLQEIILSSNKLVTPNGWSRILLGVITATHLKYLHLDFNNLDDNCGYLIASAICSNQALEVLDLEQTGIGNKSVELFLYIIRNYKLNLKVLNLMNNGISDVLEKEVKKLIKNDYDVNESLNQLNKADQDMTRQSLEVISKRNNNKNLSRKLRDQFKLDKMFEKAQKLKPNSYSKLQKSNNLAETKEANYSGEEFENENFDDQYEFLKTYDDLRFKTHTVLPFNLNKF